MKSNPWLVLSSLCFIGPSITCYLTDNTALSGMYVLVTTVSSTYHATKHPTLLYLDYTTAQIAHFYTVLTIYKGGWASMPYYLIWFIYTVYTYYYGYVYNTLIWNPDLDAATSWHMLMHFSSSLTTCYTVYATYKNIR
jgi:hypothetical protein